MVVYVESVVGKLLFGGGGKSDRRFSSGANAGNPRSLLNLGEIIADARYVLAQKQAGERR